MTFFGGVERIVMRILPSLDEKLVVILPPNSTDRVNGKQVVAAIKESHIHTYIHTPTHRHTHSHLQPTALNKTAGIGPTEHDLIYNTV